MTAHELAKQLLKMPDVDIIISVDVSTSEEDADVRVFAQPIEIQNNGGPFEEALDISILCEEL